MSQTLDLVRVVALFGMVGNLCLADPVYTPVSYTHLTLPTIYSV